MEKQPETTAMILARPERRRLLRWLLDLPRMTASQRLQYAELIRVEWMETSRASLDDVAPAVTEQRVFSEALLGGQSVEQATAEAVDAGERYHEPTRGQQERDRRRRFREAVTAFDGRAAVTYGSVSACLVCGKPIPWRSRSDRVYCGARCKVAAARKRRIAHLGLRGA